jgi:hypothetical protein
LADQMATCSPGAKRCNSARATFSASASNSANVQRRRNPASACPSTSAGRVDHRAAAARSASPIDISRTGSRASAC